MHLAQAVWRPVGPHSPHTAQLAGCRVRSSLSQQGSVKTSHMMPPPRSSPSRSPRQRLGTAGLAGAAGGGFPGERQQGVLRIGRLALSRRQLLGAAVALSASVWTYEFFFEWKRAQLAKALRRAHSQQQQQQRPADTPAARGGR